MPSPRFVVCLAHFCEIHGPSTIICTQRQTSTGPMLTSTLSLCESCALILPKDATNIVTDVEYGASPQCYISTKYPQSPRLYTSLMKLVMKCLSVEATADPLKPLFYGDATNGFCLSKVFSIPDLHARGAERKYAFLVLCDSETRLLERWHFVSSYISEMIAFLQTKVEAVRDQAKIESLDNERYLRRLKNMPRSLVELAGDKELFVRLHLCGIELLRDVR
ncbi:hypothetical protein METBIDRAFT_78035 [Metschnikowia bicuspidata var. bicuspidata NRRL YB-4993]|uniref:UDENN FLCN/SMCR8-type domain-containing protein n=1 Tax=Metschnikowia bicuspidata var. bicuspidata NRRL YB-4993 TaxID=869754 RepID=A0A1A0HAK5_9ASCO|nr:hypothetical protein METBIDRAFT_78035 [Metschnikowia bicuspidata var. bicuspidata NRRL YB-4993]OBA20907.1 hypothetical protein METBIDRAFT_78035 [Metschnikowia bicuspidata var. bicuspidata NRRL YB-4993]